jgi:DNA-binding transcriptional regulator YhcF (GntR family)
MESGDKMIWKFETVGSISGQIVSTLRNKILCGEYKIGEQFPTVRSLASDFAVNPNTIQKSLSVLEQEGLLICKTNVGRFVTDDKTILEKAREEYKKSFIEAVLNKSAQLGIDKNTFIKYINESEVLK